MVVEGAFRDRSASSARRARGRAGTRRGGRRGAGGGASPRGRGRSWTWRDAIAAGRLPMGAFPGRGDFFTGLFTGLFTGFFEGRSSREALPRPGASSEAGSAGPGCRSRHWGSPFPEHGNPTPRMRQEPSSLGAGSGSPPGLAPRTRTGRERRCPAQADGRGWGPGRPGMDPAVPPLQRTRPEAGLRISSCASIPPGGAAPPRSVAAALAGVRIRRVARVEGECGSLSSPGAPPVSPPAGPAPAGRTGG